jgi:hypothetical protein
MKTKLMKNRYGAFGTALTAAVPGKRFTGPVQELKLPKHRAPKHLAQEHLSGVVDGQNGFAFRTAKAAGLEGLELFGTNGAGKNLGKQGHRLGGRTGPKEIDGIVQVILDIEKLGKTQELEHFVHLGLNFQQYQVPPAGLNGLEKSGKGTDPGGRDIVKAPALEHQTDKSPLDGLLNPLLEIVGIVGVDVPRQVQHKATVNLRYFLKFNLEAVVLFVVKTVDYIVVRHSFPSTQVLTFFT